MLVRKLKAPNRQPPVGREGVCERAEGGGGFSKEKGGGVFVVAEGESSAGYDLAASVNGNVRLAANTQM